MPEFRVRVVTVCRSVGEDLFLAEALRFPEVSRVADRPEAAREAARKAARVLLARGELVEAHRRSVSGEPEGFSVAIEVRPRRGDPAWREPVALTLGGVRWVRPDGVEVARVPALGVEVVRSGGAPLEEMVRDHAARALSREGLARDLVALARLETEGELSLEARTVAAALPTPEERAGAEEEGRTPGALERLTEPLRVPWQHPAACERDDLLDALVDLLGEPYPASVLLVGPSGAGKTALLHELVRRRKDLGFPRHRFRVSAGARLISGAAGFGMWQERCQELCREAGEQPTILHLGRLVELVQVGRHEGSDQGVGSFLRPWIERRQLQVVLECTPEELSAVEREEPHLARVLERLDVPEPTPEVASRILHAVAPRFARGAPVPGGVVDVVDRLHRRYATYSASPGRPLRFLRDLVRELPPATSPTESEATERFSRQTGLPRFMLEDAEPLDLGATRRWFDARLIGQPAAVDLVVDLLASVKAALGRPGQPLASLLFVGPTGVGKTEMAKSLAAFLFGDRARLTRLDMSEFSDPVAARRLVGGSPGTEGLLTAPARDQPFSVILLDEVEKADASVFDLLLQVLGEGRLTDAAGRLADFRNAVVVMTSNLGAESYGKPTPGFEREPPGPARAVRHFTRVVEEFFRPELVNRLDRIVPFEPLGPASLREIADRELERLRERDGLRYRGVRLEWTADLADLVAAEGGDPRYGARPLKRTLEHLVVTPLARALNAEGEDAVGAVRLDVAEGAVTLRIERAEDEEGPATRPDPELYPLARDATALRRRVAGHEDLSLVRRLRNEDFRLSREEDRRNRRRRRPRPPDPERERRRRALRSALGALDSLAAGIEEVEERALLALYGVEEVLPPDPGACAVLEDQVEEACAELLRLATGDADRVVLALWYESWSCARRLLAAWAEAGRDLGAALEVRIFRAPKDVPELPREATTEEVLEARAPPLGDLDRALEDEDSGPPGAVGLLVEATGPGIRLHFEGEVGAHLFRDGGLGLQRCLVERAPAGPETYEPPEDYERKAFLSGLKHGRTYDLRARSLEDPGLRNPLSWKTTGFAAAVRQAMRLLLASRVERAFAPRREDA